MEGLDQTAKLLQLIRERGFEPGDKLPSERDLAAEFGMSRGAVREALIRLDTLRIIESRPKSGIYLQPYGAERSIEAMVLFAETNTPLSAAEVAQSVELRSVLESEALRLACLRRTPEDLQRLQAILDQSEAAIDGLSRHPDNRQSAEEPVPLVLTCRGPRYGQVNCGECR